MWFQFQERLAEAIKRAGRPEDSVYVLPVSKGQTWERIEAMLKASANFPRKLGESYLPELEAKQMASFEVMHDTLEWHFLGRLQSNKFSQICDIVSCLHAVGRAKEIELLGQRNKEELKIPDFFLQVNASKEITKNGFDAEEIPEALELVDKLGLEASFLGFMGFPAPLEEIGEAELRKQFSALRALRDRLAPAKLLNMGVSADFEIAIEEGSDLIRAGTVLFGARV